jgi:hypothetical protein
MPHPWSVAINNNGEVAFAAQWADSYGAPWKDAIVRGSGGPLTPIVVANDSGFLAGTLAFNDAGTVVFSALGPGAGIQQTFNIYSGDGNSPITPIHIGSHEPLSGALDVDINSSGKVALATQGGLLYVYDGSSLNPVITQTIPPSSNGFGLPAAYNPSINNLDEIAYLLAYGPLGNTNGGTIAVGSDPVSGHVIGVGDVLDGSTVAQGFGRLGAPKLNDRGQVAFAATLADGRIGLYVATPLEPGDADGNGVIDAADLAPILANFGQTGLMGRVGGDANADGAVDGADFLVWQNGLGSTTLPPAPNSIPEPSGAVLAIFLLSCMVRWHLP